MCCFFFGLWVFWFLGLIGFFLAFVLVSGLGGTVFYSCVCVGGSGVVLFLLFVDRSSAVCV